MKASHKKRWWTMKTGKSKIEVELMPGQFVYGRLSAAKELNMKPSTVRNRMKKLENMRNLDIKEDSQYSIISIINWDTYQPSEKKEDSKEDNQRTIKGQSKDTDKNVNTVDNDKIFDQFWELYNKKVDRKKCSNKFKKLKHSEIDLIFKTLPAYIEKTPDIQFRKNPLTYLNGESWNDDLNSKGRSTWSLS